MRLPPVVFLLLLLLPAASRAEFIRFEFGGVIVNPVLPGLSEGDPFTGRLTYDLAPTFQALTYIWEPPYDASIGIDVTVGAQVFSSDDADLFHIEVEQGIAFDYFYTASTPAAPLSLYLSDSSRTAFDSTDLPTSLSLEDFDQAYLAQVLPGPRGDVSILFIGTVESLVQIPEPASGALALAGLLVLALPRRSGPSHGVRRRRP